MRLAKKCQPRRARILEPSRENQQPMLTGGLQHHHVNPAVDGSSVPPGSPPEWRGYSMISRIYSEGNAKPFYLNMAIRSPPAAAASQRKKGTVEQD